VSGLLCFSCALRLVTHYGAHQEVSYKSGFASAGGDGSCAAQLVEGLTFTAMGEQSLFAWGVSLHVCTRHCCPSLWAPYLHCRKHAPMASHKHRYLQAHEPVQVQSSTKQSEKPLWTVFVRADRYPMLEAYSTGCLECSTHVQLQQV